MVWTLRVVSSRRVLPRLTCFARGGHKWSHVMDASGSITYCERCGRLRHARPSPADIHHQAHGNLGYQPTLRDEPGADAIDDRK